AAESSAAPGRPRGGSRMKRRSSRAPTGFTPRPPWKEDGRIITRSRPRGWRMAVKYHASKQSRSAPARKPLPISREPTTNTRRARVGEGHDKAGHSKEREQHAARA